MAIDLSGKDYSPGQIAISVWDETNNATRVNLVAGGGVGSGLSLEATQLNVLAAVQALEPNSSLSALGNPVYFDYAVDGPVDDSTYVQIIADSGATAVRQLNIFDSSGKPLYLAFGAAASEVDQILICPGGPGQLPMLIPAHTRVSIKCVLGQSADSGELIISLFG